MIKIVHVKGEDKGKIMLYALSTCIWCRKTKNLLEKLNVAFDYIFVDLLEEEDKDKVIDELTKYNPRCSFPTMVFNDDKTIIGFKEDEIQKVLEK